MFYPSADEGSCTAALLLDIDAVALVRTGRGHEAVTDQYVNDRPDTVSSLYVSGPSAGVWHRVGGPLPSPTGVSADADLAPGDPGGDSLIRRLFQPLGCTMSIEGPLLDDHFPEWGNSPYDTMTYRLLCRCTSYWRKPPWRAWFSKERTTCRIARC